MMRCAGHEERMGEARMREQFLLGSLKWRDLLEELGVDGMIILK